MKKNLIHIHAKCDAFEIWEIKTEKQSHARLKTIHNMFAFADKHYPYGAGKLFVKTGLINPTLAFN